MEREGRTGLEIEGRKEKKKRHKGNGKKEGLGVDSALIEGRVDEMGKVMEGENGDKKGGAHVTGREGVGEGKKRKRRREIKEGLGGASSSIDACVGEMGNVVVKGLNCDNKVGTHVNGRDGKKKKRKRERENKGYDAVMNNVSDEKVFMDDMDKTNVETEEEVDLGGGSSKKGKAIREDEEMRAAVEYEDAAEVSNEAGDMKRKNEKLKKRKVGGELVQNVTTKALEREVKSQSSNVKEKRNNRSKLLETISEKLNGKSSDREDSDRDVDTIDVDDEKLRKNKGESEQLVGLEDINKYLETVNLEDGSKRKKKNAKTSKCVNVEGCTRSTEAVMMDDGEKKNTSGVEASQSDGPSDKKLGLVKGRFSKEEDKILKEVVLTYIEELGLGVDGLNMVLHCRSHPDVKNHPGVLNCWKVIAEAMPWRHYKSVYSRAHTLFEGAGEQTWTPEEYAEVRKFHSEHGADWKKLAAKLGKYRVHVKDAFRRLKQQNHRKGPWCQEEYQTLFDLVNKDLLMRASEERKTKHGMLRGNICWEAISDKLGTRTNAVCSMKWYNQLVSPLVKQKLWADIDDYRLLDALSKLEASCIEDVEWDDLLEHRPGDVCRQRWDQMVKYIGEHVMESFPEQVAVLSKRYPAHLIEAIEVYDSKPVAD
ncbi:uncharacterized protein LOC126787777 [Argentina anserina]|uniref:uncharacterized protein LOC126787777 n=1 Tax=Argentina anserina TaxID=57926 RepID=UPI0021765817|nr:uncharacterized protein LOC126787777 [Potentilla anserina]XP_050369642.1 uncharacterized protein LOC126787777 [Potentilla anserina]XP_050369648.1 uncharacterized protein LOC126787777 [Potentilla anserina]